MSVSDFFDERLTCLVCWLVLLVVLDTAVAFLYSPAVLDGVKLCFVRLFLPVLLVVVFL
jgi:hypothetical protein